MNYSRLPLGSKLTITLFLIAALLGLLFQHMQLRQAVELKDDERGLTPTDIQYFFSGNPQRSLLEVVINGPMHRDFTGPAEVEAIEAWIADGATSETYERSVATIIENRCIRCHSPEGERAQSSLMTYEDLLRFATARDLGVNETELARLSARTLFGAGVLLALVCALFYATRFRGPWKQVLIPLPFAALLINVLSWWSVKQTATFIHLIIGSALVGIITLLLIALLILLDVWILPEYREYEEEI